MPEPTPVFVEPDILGDPIRVAHAAGNRTNRHQDARRVVPPVPCTGRDTRVHPLERAVTRPLTGHHR